MRSDQQDTKTKWQRTGTQFAHYQHFTKSLIDFHKQTINFQTHTIAYNGHLFLYLLQQDGVLHYSTSWGICSKRKRMSEILY